MSALGIVLAVWLALALVFGIALGQALKGLRRAHPLVRTAANNDVILSSPPVPPPRSPQPLIFDAANLPHPASTVP